MNEELKEILDKKYFRKILYIAPSKYICEDIFEEWEEKEGLLTLFKNPKIFGNTIGKNIQNSENTTHIYLATPESTYRAIINGELDLDTIDALFVRGIDLIDQTLSYMMEEKGAKLETVNPRFLVYFKNFIFFLNLILRLLHYLKCHRLLNL